jgi:hypothetical protein
MLATKGWMEGETGNYCLMGTVSTWDNEKNLEIEL